MERRAALYSMFPLEIARDETSLERCPVGGIPGRPWRSRHLFDRLRPVPRHAGFPLADPVDLLRGPRPHRLRVAAGLPGAADLSREDLGLDSDGARRCSLRSVPILDVLHDATASAVERRAAGRPESAGLHAAGQGREPGHALETLRAGCGGRGGGTGRASVLLPPALAYTPRLPRGEVAGRARRASQPPRGCGRATSAHPPGVFFALLRGAGD